MKAFIGNICLRSSCSDCTMKEIERCTDFSLGDYWGIWNQHPKFDDNKGTSVMLVHSQCGQEILNQLQQKIDCLRVDIKDTYRENRSLIDFSVMHDRREDFLERITAENFEKLVREYFFLKNEQKQGLLQRIKRKLDRILML